MLWRDHLIYNFSYSISASYRDLCRCTCPIQPTKSMFDAIWYIFVFPSATVRCECFCSGWPLYCQHTSHAQQQFKDWIELNCMACKHKYTKNSQHFFCYRFLLSILSRLLALYSCQRTGTPHHTNSWAKRIISSAYGNQFVLMQNNYLSIDPISRSFMLSIRFVN